MGKNVLVIGEESWRISKENIKFYCHKHPTEVNLYSDDSRKLYFLSSANEWTPLTAVLWRCQFYDNYAIEHKLLDLIAYTKTPCINSAYTNIAYGHNISMHFAMIECGLPVISRRFMIGSRSAMYVRPDHDVDVFKVGDYHQGFAKSIIRSMETYQDTIDMANCLNDIQSLEPYKEYVRDVRILKIGDSIEIYERIPSIWKANVCPLAFNKLDTDAITLEIINDTCKLARYTKAEIIGVDWIQDKLGNWYALEANLAPGLESEDNYGKIAALL